MISGMPPGPNRHLVPQPLYPSQHLQNSFMMSPNTLQGFGYDSSHGLSKSYPHLDRPRPHARPVQPPQNAPSRWMPSSAGISTPISTSENMLRRKTPNGTLAAGYDGSPVEWPSRPHASKYFILPSSTENISFTSSVIENPQLSRSSPHYTANMTPSQIQNQHVFSQRGKPAQPSGPVGYLEPSLFWSPNATLSPGVDSVLSQTSLYAQPHRLADPYQAPPMLQPLWPPCLRSMSSQTRPTIGPYWPNGTYEPYRPAPGRDPGSQSTYDNEVQFPGSSKFRLSNAQLPVLENEFALGLGHSSQPQAASQELRQHLLHQQQSDFYNPNSDFNSGRGTALHGTPIYPGDESSWSEQQQSSNLDHAYSNLRLSSLDGAVNSQTAPRGTENKSGNAQFKEKVLAWAHRIYGVLLATIEQERRNASQEQQAGHGSTHHQSHHPRRPYPSWTVSQSRENASNNPSSTPLHTPINTIRNTSFSDRMQHVQNVPNSKTGSGRADALYPPYVSPSMPAKDRHGSHLGLSGSAAQASYVPPQLMHDQNQNSPAAAAAYAMEMLGRLCEESKWSWNDGMLLNGCLAYGLGHYNKALKLYSKVLQNDSNNVEAMSNLAATLMSLDRKQEAEQYWLSSVKLRPSYFEAVEHLVGLLHENHRGREAVSIVEHVEQALRENRFSSVKSTSMLTTRHERQFAYNGFNLSGYKIPPSDNGRLLALIHGKGNVLYQMGDNVGAAKAFEEAIRIGAGRPHQGVHSLIKDILGAFAVGSKHPHIRTETSFCTDEPILLPPEMALETSQLVFPPHGRLPGLEQVSNAISQKAAMSIVSNSLLSLAKIYQDGMSSSGASATAPRATSGVQEILALYYMSLSLQPSPSTANNVGILLAGVQQSARSRIKIDVSGPQACSVPGVHPGSGVALALAYYDYGLKLDSGHAHLYTNLGSLFKDIGQLNAAIKMYEKAVLCDGNFDIALANLANAVKDKGDIGQAINYYKRAVTSNPDFAEAVCGLANALNSVCMWNGRGGIAPSRGKWDRWHVDENGKLYDSKIDGTSKSGWIEQVVAIVDKQLLDGQSWGQRILASVGVDNLLSQLGQAFQYSKDHSQASVKLRQSLEAWSANPWEGAKVVRLVERATKRLAWQMYQDQYVNRQPDRNQGWIRPQIPAALAVPSAPTVLPFHTFTCPLSAKQIRKISQRNGLRVSCSTLRAPWLPKHIFDPPPPPQPHLNVGYVSSDFNNHPLAHLMQSVFGLHNTQKVKAICYATTASDNSIHRQQIEREAPVFYDASSWSTERLVNQVVADGIHILVNLNGYTRGAKNEVFAARPAPIQMSFMGFAGTLGAEWCDYLLADKVAIPRQTLRPWRGNVDLVDQTQDGNNDDEQNEDWVYGENIIFTKHTFFCCDHRQSAPDAQDQQLTWAEEQGRRWKMRRELFPDLADDAVILGNFNQLYKVRLQYLINTSYLSF